MGLLKPKAKPVAKPKELPPPEIYPVPTTRKHIRKAVACGPEKPAKERKMEQQQVRKEPDPKEAEGKAPPPPPPPKPLTAKEELAKHVDPAVSDEVTKAVVAATVDKLDDKGAEEIMARIRAAAGKNPIEIFLAPPKEGEKIDEDDQVKKALDAIAYLSATRQPIFDAVAGQLAALLVQLHPLPPERPQDKQGGAKK